MQSNKRHSRCFICKKWFSILLDRLKTEMSDSDSSLSVAIYEYCLFCDNNKLDKLYEDILSAWKKLIDYGILNNRYKNVNTEAVANTIIFTYEGTRIASKLMQIEPKKINVMVDIIRTILI